MKSILKFLNKMLISHNTHGKKNVNFEKHNNCSVPINYLLTRKQLLNPSLYFAQSVLRRAFAMFDSTKSGKIEKEKVRTILNTLGHTFDDHELDIMLKAEDDEGRLSPILYSTSIYISIPRQLYSRLHCIPADSLLNPRDIENFLSSLYIYIGIDRASRFSSDSFFDSP